MSQQSNPLHAKILNAVHSTAYNTSRQNKGCWYKAEGGVESPVNEADRVNTAALHQLFDAEGIPLVIEEDGPEYGGQSTFAVFDPLDGSYEHRNGGNQWCVAGSHFENGVPLFSAFAGWGYAPCHVMDGKVVGPADMTTHGLLAWTDGNRNLYTPLIGSTEVTVAPVVSMGPPVPVGPKFTLLTDPNVSVIAGLDVDTGAFILSSRATTIGIQMMVALGQAQAALFGPRWGKEVGNAHGRPNPAPKLWDLVPKLVENAGLVYILASGNRRGELVGFDELLKVVDHRFWLTEKLLVCHPSQLDQVLELVDDIQYKA